MNDRYGRGMVRTGRTGRARRAWRAARHPLTIPLWGVIAAWSFRSLHEQRTFGGVTLTSLGRLAEDVLGGHGIAGQTLAWPFDLYGVGTGDAWRIIDTNVHSADELTRLWQEQPELVVQVAIVLEDEWRGLVAFTRLRTTDRVTITPFTDRTLSADEQGAVRRAAVDYMLLESPSGVLSRERAGRIAHLRSADAGGSGRVWRGYAVNAGLVVGLVMTTLSLARAAAMTPTFARARARRRRRRGLCVGCAYPITGVVGGVCPECGLALPEPERACAEAR